MSAPSDEYRLLIGGEWVRAGGGTYDIVNPATEQVVGAAPNASVDDAETACAAAADAFPAWSATSQEERSELLARVADVLEKRTDELVPLVQAETGATMRVAKHLQVPQAAVRFRRYARIEPDEIPLSPSVMDGSALSPGGVVGAVVRRAPVGVVSCIASYNFPMTNMAGKIAPALAMGNTVVVKPAWQDPLAVIRMCEAFEEAGFPPGVVNVVVSDQIPPSEQVVASDHVDMISFTGSTAVGTRIAEVAGRGMKRTLMELGGKGACIVFDDADLKAAGSGIASVWGFHSGQICTSPTRVLVQRGVHDQLVENLSAAAAFMKVGDPLDKGTLVGPVITAAHRERVEGYVHGAVDQGAEAAAGGERPDLDTGFYVAPTLLVGCTPDMTAVREEIFGPVVAVVPFDDADEAVALANDSEYGLNSYVYSGDTARAVHVARRVRSGSVAINTLQQHPEAAFGGFKKSGIGRDRGSFGLHAYSELQSIAWQA